MFKISLTKKLIFLLAFFIFGFTLNANAQSSYWKNYFSSEERKAVQKNAEKYTISEIESKSEKWKELIRGYHIKNGTITDEDIKEIGTDKISGLGDYIDQKISGSSTPQTPQDFSADNLTGSYAALDGSQIINLNPGSFAQGEFKNFVLENSSSAPTSPINGQTYFNTTTKKPQWYDDVNDRQRSLPQEATFIVAASDSRNKEGADYICDGVDDNVQIQEALNALPDNGGKVQLLEGNYVISEEIKVSSSTTLQGMGNASRIIVGVSTENLGGSVIANANQVQNNNMDEGNMNISIRDLYIDGNAGSTMYCGDLEGGIQFIGVRHGSVENVYIKDPDCNGIKTEFSDFIKVTGNTIENSRDDAIPINRHTHYALVSNNLIINPVSSGGTYGGPTGIEVQDGSHDVVISDNIIKIKDPITALKGIGVETHDTAGYTPPYNIIIDGNIINNESTGYEPSLLCFSLDGYLGTAYTRNITISNNYCAGEVGVDINYVENLIIQGNTFDIDKKRLFYIQSNIKNVKISDNIAQGTNAPSIIVYALNGSYNQITNLEIVDNSFLMSSYEGFAYMSTFVMNNVVFRGNNIEAGYLFGFGYQATYNSVRFIENKMSGSWSHSNTQNFAGVIFKDNIGTYDLNNKGIATINAGSSSVTVTHGLTPSNIVTDTIGLGDIKVTMLGNPGVNVSNFWISDITSTTFNINTNGNVTSNTNFAWNIGQ